MNRRIRFVQLPIILASVLLLTRTPGIAEEKINQKRLIVPIVKTALERYHFSKKLIDDKLSADAFDIYLKQIDFSKRFLLDEDIVFLSKFRTRIDDELNTGSLHLMEQVNRLLQKRVSEVEEITRPLFATPFTFSDDESFELEPEKRKFPADRNARRDLWRRIIKASVIERVLGMEQELADEKEEKEKNQEKELVKDPKRKLPPQTFAGQEEKAREESQKLFSSLFRRLLRRDSQDELRDYLNAVTLAFDPHTTYMPQRDEDNFNISISGSLEGIGAMLQEDGDDTKVTEIVPGGAAWRQGATCGRRYHHQGWAEGERGDQYRWDEAW